VSGRIQSGIPGRESHARTGDPNRQPLILDRGPQQVDLFSRTRHVFGRRAARTESRGRPLEANGAESDQGTQPPAASGHPSSDIVPSSIWYMIFDDSLLMINGNQDKTG
jgi:hypothetical protein